MKPFGYIYLIRNTVNGKVYVGQTTIDVPTRWIKHLTYKNEGVKKRYPLYSAMKKYGIEAFTISTLATANDRTTLDLKERILIRAYRATSVEHGYNRRGGGFAGGRMTEEVKAKISAANKGKIRTPEAIEAFRARILGSKHSEETKAKMSAAHLGRKMPPRSPEHAKKLGDAKRGTKQSEETKEKRAAKHRGRKNTPETIERMRLAALNRSPEAREKNRVGIQNGHALRKSRTEIAGHLRGVMNEVIRRQNDDQPGLFPGSEMD